MNEVDNNHLIHIKLEKLQDCFHLIFRSLILIHESYYIQFDKIFNTFDIQ